MADKDKQPIQEAKMEIHFGEENPKIRENKNFPNNKIETTKYNLMTFFPKSLLMQFRRAANVYFLIVSILTFMSFSPKQPASMIGTFAFVLIATMIKELVEDWGRYKQDQKSNNRLVWKMTEGVWDQVKCWTLMPGDIVKVEKDEEFSADVLILKSTNDNGYCYIDTKNLDGETNLKEKAALEEFKNSIEYELHKVQGEIECELPNENLSSWKGKVTVTSGLKSNNKKQTNIEEAANIERENLNNNPIYCKISNIILKGCVLKNTDYICGIVVYSGKNTKIMKNSKSARIKVSSVLKIMNRLLYSLFVFQMALCLTFGAFNLIWVKNYQSSYTYIFLDSGGNASSSFVKFLTYFATFFVAYSHMIPISLYVALELVKILQGTLIHFDDEIFDFSIEKPANCRATDLVEELGQVEFIFSDKTGTLTQNVMVLKKVYLCGKVYGIMQDEQADAQFTINGDTHLVNKILNPNEDIVEKSSILEFLRLLSTCHAVFPEIGKEKKTIYQGASPDDIALVKGAQQIGFEFAKKEFDDLIVENLIEKTREIFELKIEMPFDSDRKRMSVVVKNKMTNEYILYSKGADTMMLPRMTIVNTSEEDEVIRVIKVLSKEGLRVLVMGRKTLDESTYLNWEKRYKEARNMGKEDQLNTFYEELENNLTFLGCSAIEDKLQDGVSETIYTLLTCNIRVWVLTGDKQDTAEEIAKSCKLINENMFILHLVEDKKDTREKILSLKDDFDISMEEGEEQNINLELISRKIRKKRGKDMSIVIDGFTLEIILNDPNLSLYFFQVAIAAKSVVCCRVTPKQKSKVVSLAKSYGKWVTLSIGDGANDVPMIMEAHIGVGIQGKEGTQAVRSADFSIGQFRFLEKLLLFYGRLGYIKVSKFICYYFYKNIILIFTDLLFNFQNGFSGQIYFADYLSTLYNAFFTSWPCLFTFSLERDVDMSIIKRFPILYEAGQKNFYFNMKVFWVHIFYAIFHGFMCFFISNEGLINANDESGVTFNHWYKSTVSFSLVIHVVTYKLLIISDFWNGFSIFSTFLSIIFYYLVVLLLCYDPMAFLFQNELAGLIYNLMSYSKFWMVILVGPLVTLLPDITFKMIFYSSCPNPTDYIKRYLRDPTFKSILFKEEKTSAMFNSPEARRAEKVLKEILKKAREHKFRRRLNVTNATMIHLSNDKIRDNNTLNYLLLNENREGYKNKSNNLIPLSDNTNLEKDENSVSIDSSRESFKNIDSNNNREKKATEEQILESKSNSEKEKSDNEENSYKESEKNSTSNKNLKNLIKRNTFAKIKTRKEQKSEATSIISEEKRNAESIKSESSMASVIEENKKEKIEQKDLDIFQNNLIRVFHQNADEDELVKNLNMLTSMENLNSMGLNIRDGSAHKTIKKIINEYERIKTFEKKETNVIVDLDENNLENINKNKKSKTLKPSKASSEDGSEN
jgi:phospholipid-transporting ATPase